LPDPHVKTLFYRLEFDGPAMFSGTAPFKVDTAAFRVSYAGRTLAVEMIEHHATAESAHAAVQPYLRAWEIDDALTLGRPQISFRFDRAVLIDRDPPSPSEAGVPRIVETIGIASSEKFGSGTVTMSRPFPRPPTGFVASADVETLFERWRGFLAGREPLPGMAYFCLTVVEMYGAQRADAAKHFAVARNVLTNIGRLCASGDPSTARKASATPTPLTASETAFLEAAVRALIRRVGEVAASPGGSFAEITMADLPQL
jgi:hypothetical protein